MADSKEAQFQQDIIDAMAAGGWRVGKASGYDRVNAVYPEDLAGYFQEAYPERRDKFAKTHPKAPETALIKAVVRQLERVGTLEVLRHGFKMPGNKVELCSFKPDHDMNPDAQALYQANRLRVVPEVSYSPHARESGSGTAQSYNPRLDLVLFVNGLPVATLELKSAFKQSVENAERQYRYDRPVKDPVTRKAELADVSDANVVYDLQQSLDASGIYHWQEVEAFSTAFFDPKAPASKLSFYCKPATERFATRYKVIVDQIQTWQAERKQAEQQGDQAGVHRADQELKDAGTTRDELDLFRKNLTSFVRTYEFLSQIVYFDDRELEQLCVLARHLAPLLKSERLEQDTIDVSELELTHYCLTKRAEHQLRLEEEQGDYGLQPISEVGSGKPHDPEKKRLGEIIDKLNDLYGAEVSDDDKLHFANGIAGRIERDESAMAQVRHHDEGQVMHGLFPKQVTDAVLNAMNDHEKLSMPLLEDEKTGREFALLILNLLAGRDNRFSANQT